MKKVLAGIILHNGSKFLPACIDSTLKSNTEILVIDNHSTDGSLNYLASLKNVNLIKNGSNTGFTNAANQAIEYAINLHFDYLLLLNQDTEFEKEMIPKLCQSFEENPSLAIVSPMQMNEKNEPEYQFKKNCTDFGIDLTKPKTIEVPFVNAACWLMDLKKVRDIGLLLPIFKNYGSDFNYCHRIIHSGFKIGINSEAKIIHKKYDKDYETNFLKSIKSRNTYYLALIINPMTNSSSFKITALLAKGIVLDFIKFKYKKALFNSISFLYIIAKIEKIKSSILNQKQNKNSE